VCSETALKRALDTNPLTLIYSYFGEKTILGTVSQQIDEKGCFKKPKKWKLPSQNLAVKNHLQTTNQLPCKKRLCTLGDTTSTKY
jgi:hypothetical protein